MKPIETMEPRDIISLGAILLSSVSIILSVLSYIVSRKNSIRDTFFICLDKYLEVMKTRSDAINGNSVPLAKAYYREYLDLLWTEFNLLQGNMINPGIYKRWMKTRNKEYTDNKDNIYSGIGIFKDKRINYLAEWEELKTNYFDPNDPFIKHMDLVHNGQIDEAIKMAKRKKPEN